MLNFKGNFTKVILATLAIALPFIFPVTALADSAKADSITVASMFSVNSFLWIMGIFGILCNIAIIIAYWEKYKKELIQAHTAVAILSFLCVYIPLQGFNLLLFVTVYLTWLSGFGIMGGLICATGWDSNM